MDVAARQEGFVSLLAPTGKPLSGPERLLQMHLSMAGERVLAASVQLNVFSHVANGKRTAPEIASAAQASERGMRMLLDALVGFGLLSKTEGLYALGPEAARYLVRESPEYMGAILEGDHLWSAWSHLVDAIRSGKPVRSATNQAEAEKFFPVLVRTLHISNSEPARRLASVLASPGAERGLRVLDIGCGSAVWSIAVAKADSLARVTAFDYEKVLDTTREFVAREGVGKQFDFLAGDLRTFEFQPAGYDLVILGNIVHGESPKASRDLFARIHRALSGGGRLAIIDMLPNDERTGPPFPLFFALNMLVNTDEGSTYTLAEYRAWLTATGFAEVETADVGLHSPAIVATKANV